MFGAERAPAVGVAHVLQPFAIGRLQRQRIFHVGRRIRSAAAGLQFLLQQAQGVRQRRAAGQFRRRVDVAAAIGNRQRLAAMGAEGGEVVDRERAAGGLDIGRDAARQVALVEIARAFGGEVGQRRLQPVLRQPHAGLDAPLRVRRQAVLEIGGGTGRIAPEVGGRTRDHQRGPPVHQKAFAGELDAGAEQFLPRHFGVAAMRLFHAGDHAGHRDRARTMQVAVVLDPRPGEDIGGRAVAGQRIVLGPQAVRRAHAVVDHLVAVLARAVEHHRPAAADAAHPGLQHPQRKGGRDHGIDAVAAGCQHGGADLGRLARLRSDDAAFGGGGGFADLLGVGELVVHRGCLVVFVRYRAELASCGNNGTLRTIKTNMQGEENGRGEANQGRRRRYIDARTSRPA